MFEKKNTVELVGFLANDPIFSRGDEKARATFILSVPRGEGNQKDNIPMVAWGKHAEDIAKFCGKGKELEVKGVLETTSYEKGGATIWSTRVRVTWKRFGDDPKKSSASAHGDLDKTDAANLVLRLLREGGVDIQGLVAALAKDAMAANKEQAVVESPEDSFPFPGE